MEIAKTFVVKAPVAATWAFLTDPRRVAQCLPGAAVTGQIDDRTHAGTISMKVGPVTASFKGTMKFERIDAASHTAEIVAAGQDLKGKGGADMRMTSRLVERAPGETEVSITSTVNIVGPLAQFGRGIIQDVSDQLFDRFVGAVRAELEAAIEPVGSGSSAPAMSATARTTGLAEAAPALPPIDVLSTTSGAVGRAAGRSARRPLVWVVLFAVMFFLYWVFGR